MGYVRAKCGRMPVHHGVSSGLSAACRCGGRSLVRPRCSRRDADTRVHRAGSFPDRLRPPRHVSYPSAERRAGRSAVGPRPARRAGRFRSVPSLTRISAACLSLSAPAAGAVRVPSRLLATLLSRAPAARPAPRYGSVRAATCAHAGGRRATGAVGDCVGRLSAGRAANLHRISRGWPPVGDFGHVCTARPRRQSAPAIRMR